MLFELRPGQPATQELPLLLYALSILDSSDLMINPQQPQWRSLLENPAAMNSVFGEADPDLSDVRLVGISVAEGGSLLTLKLAIKQAPARQPVRWKPNSANSISFELQCLGLEEASIIARSGESIVSCAIEQDREAGRVIRMVGPSTNVVIRCGFLRVDHIVPYAVDYSQDAI